MGDATSATAEELGIRNLVEELGIRNLVGELGIRNLVARNADAVNRRDADAWSTTWTRDCEWHMLGNPTQGRDGVVALWRSFMEGFPFVLQLVHSGTIELDPDQPTAASGRWYLSEIWKSPDGAGGTTVGVYHDRYVREEGAWLFARRRFDILYMGPPDLSAEPSPFPTNI
jgi:uncharacterized protein (TIGR02246 family)